MGNNITIEYTLTVKVCLEDIASHLRRHRQEPRAVMGPVLAYFENAVQVFPSGGQICPELLKIGCAKYRECNTPDGYRILYSVEGTTVTAHAILSQAQDIQQLLFKRLIGL